MNRELRGTSLLALISMGAMGGTALSLAVVYLSPLLLVLGGAVLLLALMHAAGLLGVRL